MEKGKKVDPRLIPDRSNRGGRLRLVLATKNREKIGEIAQILGSRCDILSLADFSGIPQIEEDGAAFKENAIKKAKALSEHLNMPALADDSGLEVDALCGAPGVMSSRFAGEDATDDENNAKLLQMIKDVPLKERTAQFKCVVALCYPSGDTATAEGTLEGIIIEKRKGTSGFGYDPLFLIPELGLTLAQMDRSLKNKISHRGEAVRKLMSAIK